MAEEPTLPRLPSVSWDAQARTFGNTRKRGRVGYAPSLFSNSSDPAFFSSDDDPALDNYTQDRKKKRFVGSWFAQQPASRDSVLDEGVSKPRRKSKRALARQPDSGVWMVSDGTDGEEGADELPPPTQSMQPGPRPRQRSGFQRVPSLVVSSVEQVARRKIQECIEDGNENIDLSSLRLDSLSSATVDPLAGFSCIPMVTAEVAFLQKDPSLKLYLASNSLTRLPGGLFNIEHLTLLSLRGNQLTELPPAIAKLENLEVLNVSQNSLNYLPYELLELLAESTKFKELLLHPNPFWKAVVGTDARADDNVIDNEHNHDSITEEVVVFEKGPFCKRFVGFEKMRSPVQYSDSAGRLCSKFCLGENPVEAEHSTAKPNPPSTIPHSGQPALSSSVETRTTRVPTLLELALQACYQTSQLGELPSLLPENSPPHLRTLLQRALGQRETGGLGCSVCKRLVVMPRTEWLEWYLLHKRWRPDDDRDIWIRRPLCGNPDERIVPFLRRGCSWRCVPGEVSRSSSS